MYQQVDDITRLAATNRAKRLNKEQNNFVLGMLYDLIFGALPWTLGAALVALAFQLLAVAVPEALKTYAVFSSPVAISAISSFAAFLLVSKQSTALANNARIVGEFGNASGSVINLCLFVKAQMASGKSVEYLTLPDGKGSFYQTTRIALVCSSIMGVLKYSGRGKPIWPEGLALSQDPRLLAAFKAYISPSNGSPGLAPFAALILMVGELIDEFQIGERASEYAVIFNQINAITAAEGAISGVRKMKSSNRLASFHVLSQPCYDMCLCSMFESFSDQWLLWPVHYGLHGTNFSFFLQKPFFKIDMCLTPFVFDSFNSVFSSSSSTLFT